MMLSNMQNIGIILAILMLAIASYTDIRKREIDDKIWMIFGGLSVLLLFFTPNLFDYLKMIGISLIIVPVVLLVWRIGFFGGDDAFALIVLAAIAPLSTFTEYQINPFTTLTNAILLSIIPVLVNLLRNLASIVQHKHIFEGFENESLKNKIIAVFIGHRSKNPRFSFSIETRIGNMKKMNFGLKNADSTEFCSSPDTWVTPGMPYIIYIFGGFVVQLVYGDIIFNAIKVYH